MKAYGAVWEQKLKELVEMDNLGLRAIARRLQVDPRTVRRYVGLLGLQPSWLPERHCHDRAEPEQWQEASGCSTISLGADRRGEWQALQQEHPEASKTALRQLAPATYAWLYRHDREWLNQNSPKPQTLIVENGRVNWVERDKQVLNQVEKTVRQLLGAKKPVRITASRIARMLDLQALIEHHLDRMPLTKAYLESTVEQVEDFQIRRIRWVVEELERSGEEVQRWKIVRLAGLKEHLSAKVAAFLEDELSRS